MIPGVVRAFSIFVLLVSLPACARHSLGDEQRLIIGQLTEPTSLNPLLLQGPMAGEVSALIFSRLLTADKEGRLLPDLATRVPSLANGDITDDGRTIRYHLRSGVVWQDGTPLTAADVAFTFDAIMNPQTPVPSRVGYEDVQSIKIEGPLTVVVRLKKPYSPILAEFFGPDTNYAILPRHLLERFRSLAHVAFDQAPVGSGPYGVATWAHGDHIRYLASGTFYGGRPRIREISTEFIPNAQTILTQLQTGEVNATLDGDSTLYHEYTKLPGYRVLLNPIDAAAVLFMNTSDHSLSDVRVREAVASAINAPLVARLATDGVDSAEDGARGIFSYADDPSSPWTRYDPAHARELLKELGPQGKQPRLELAYVAGEPSLESAALLIAQNLGAVGIRVDLKPLYSSISFPTLASGRFQLAIVILYAPSDPDTSWLWMCDSVPPNGFNLSRYCDPTIDRLTREAAATFDVARRVTLYHQVERLVAAAVPIDVLWQVREIDVVPKSLRGYPTGMGLAGFSRVQDWYFPL